MAHPHTVRRCEAPIPAQLPIPPPSNHSYRLAAPSRASHTRPHHSLLSDEIRGAALSRTHAQSGRRHRPCGAPCPASPARRPLPCVPRCDGDTPIGIFWWQRSTTGARRAARGDPAASLARPDGRRSSRSAFRGSFVGLATLVKFDLGAVPIQKGMA